MDAMGNGLHPDFEVVGPGGDVKLVAEVKGSNYSVERARRQISKYAEVLHAPWAMVATPQNVQLFRAVIGDRLEPIDSMPMSRLVAHYGQQNERELYFEPYVRTMLELWLRDLTIHWKKADEPPPSFGPKEFQAAVDTGTLLIEP
jgi:hypothetical protein